MLMSDMRKVRKKKRQTHDVDRLTWVLYSRQEGAFAKQANSRLMEDMEGGGEECDVRRSSRRRRGVKSYESKHA